MKELLRTSNNRDEIVRNLKIKLSSSKKITLWQKDELGNRSNFTDLLFDVFFESEGVFTLNAPSSFMRQLDLSKDIYLHLEDYDYSFKTKPAIDQKFNITFQIPRELNMKELRKYPRKYYELDDKMYVEVVFAGRDRNNVKELITLRCPLINISQGGACIVISKETIKKININAGLFVRYTARFNKAMIRNARLILKKNYACDECFAIGVEFDTPLAHSPI